MSSVPCTSPHHTRILLIDPLLRLKMGALLPGGPELLVINPSAEHLVKVDMGKRQSSGNFTLFDNVAQETIVFSHSGSIMSIMSAPMQFTTAAIAAIPTAIMKGVAPKATITIAASAMAIAGISAQELRGAHVVSTLLNFNYICESLPQNKEAHS
jgi:hypothetical protein